MRIKRIIPQWKAPKASERQYRALLLGATDDYITAVQHEISKLDLASIRLDDVRQDGLLEDLFVTFQALKSYADNLYRSPISRLPQIFSSVSSYNDNQWRRVVKVGTGLDIPPSRDHSFRSGLGIDAYRSESWLDGLQSAWVSNGADLIKSIPDQLDGKLKQMIKSAVVNGTSQKELADQIRKEYNTTRYRAELIAIDQIQKANAALTQQRQADAGVTGYIWRGVEDGRERPAHKAREGKHYEWNNPPPDGHPGQPVRCRCWAEPDFTGSIFDIAA